MRLCGSGWQGAVVTFWTSERAAEGEMATSVVYLFNIPLRSRAIILHGGVCLKSMGGKKRRQTILTSGDGQSERADRVCFFRRS